MLLMLYPLDGHMLKWCTQFGLRGVVRRDHVQDIRLHPVVRLDLTSKPLSAALNDMPFHESHLLLAYLDCI